MNALEKLKSYQITAAQVATKPWIVSCLNWGAEPSLAPSPAITPSQYVTHHTAGINEPEAGSAEMAMANGVSVARSIQHSHFAEGWSDTGNHFLVTVDGLIFEGRHGSAAGFMVGGKIPQGAQAKGHNSTTVGVEHQGNFMNVVPGRKLLVASLQLKAWACLVYDMDSHTSFVGHRDIDKGEDATLCPGDVFYAMQPALCDIVHDAVVLLRQQWVKDKSGTWIKKVI